MAIELYADTDAAERRLARRTERNVRFYAAHLDEIPERLAELDKEWDIERAMDLQSAAIGALGVTFSVTRGRHWLLVPIAMAGVLAQQALTGDSVARRLLRRLGYRTRLEIETERYALRALRGDFGDIGTSGFEQSNADADAVLGR